MTGNERFDKWGRLPGGFWRECQGGPRSLKDGAKPRVIHLQRLVDRYTLNSHLETRRISPPAFQAACFSHLSTYPGDARGNLPKCRYRRADVSRDSRKYTVPWKYTEETAREYVSGFKNRTRVHYGPAILRTRISLQPFVFTCKILN